MECARRIVPCPFACGGSYPEEDIPEHKTKTCVKRMAKPIPCPNKCGLRFVGTYDRVRDIEFEVAEHVREFCENRMISCDFNGCFDSMKASERRHHRARHLRGVQALSNIVVVGVACCSCPLARVCNV